MTLVSLTEVIDLFEHKYIEKLADEAWNGPTRANRSLLSSIHLGSL